MALIQCSQCTHNVSETAVSCPSCGHPIASQRAAEKNKDMGAGCLKGFGILFLLLSIVAVVGSKSENDATRNKTEPEVKALPPCQTDFKRCVDNAELVKIYRAKSDISLSTACKLTAQKFSRYGEPSLPFSSFQRYLPGSDYISSGIAVLFETEGRYANAFGTMVNRYAICRVNLTTGLASVELGV